MYILVAKLFKVTFIHNILGELVIAATEVDELK